MSAVRIWHDETGRRQDSGRLDEGPCWCPDCIKAELSKCCECPPCPGRGNDGHGLTHCAECCFGTGVVSDMDCPIHGYSSP